MNPLNVLRLGVSAKAATPKARTIRIAMVRAVRSKALLFMKISKIRDSRPAVFHKLMRRWVKIERVGGWGQRAMRRIAVVPSLTVEYRVLPCLRQQGHATIWFPSSSQLEPSRRGRWANYPLAHCPR